MAPINSFPPSCNQKHPEDAAGVMVRMGPRRGGRVDKRHVYTTGSGTVGLVDANRIRNILGDFGEGPNKMDVATGLCHVPQENS